MTKRTVLYVGEGLDGATAQRLSEAGFDVCTARPRQAVAILFVNRRVEAVMLEGRGNKEEACAIAAVLRSIREDVPIVLVSRFSLDQLPSGVDACVNPEANFDMLAGRLAELHPAAVLKSKAKPAA